MSLPWFTESIPRASFIMWLVFLGRLPTKDRLRRWGMNISESCVFCSSHQESHGHFFFACSFTKEIWQTFASGLCSQGTPSLLQDIQDYLLLPSTASSRTNQTILKLLLQVIVYAVWRERNGRIFSSSSASLTAIKCAVDRTVKDRLLSFPASDSRPSLLEVHFSCISSPF